MELRRNDETIKINSIQIPTELVAVCKDYNCGPGSVTYQIAQTHDLRVGEIKNDLLKTPEVEYYFLFNQLSVEVGQIINRQAALEEMEDLEIFADEMAARLYESYKIDEIIATNGMLQVVADSWTQLRGCDVQRFLELFEQDIDECKTAYDVLITNRPDLIEEAAQAFHYIECDELR